MLSRIKYALSSWIKTNPRRMQWAWQALSTARFLLPHERDYYGMRHLGLRPADLILDVGANTGLSALGFRALGIRARILSVEPNRLLEQNLRKVGSRIPDFDYRLVAAGSRTERLVLYTPVYKGVPVHVLASLDLQYAKQTVTRDYPERIAKQMAYHEQVIDVMPLDDLQLHPAFIKFDCEGFDYEAMQGLEKTIEKAKPVLLIEFTPSSFPQVKAFLDLQRYNLLIFDVTRNQFSCFSLKDEEARWRDQHLQRNIYCVPDSMMNRLPVMIQKK